ncbi:hypothetical protein [Romboutsia lituseburensis]|uniref:hypothetical protein n=1 Tax=Romboutsia lituseburensis TaxID=1537 RepID=UPI00215A7B27|nr:hypothetical protein [Romboutsia lituseburensis]MCR8745063.1 hypothetical protein [Romboutsia lituseburensis]
MTFNEFNNTNEEEIYYFEDDCCNLGDSLKTFAQSNPLLTKGLLVGSTLAAATIISPTVRKITIPTCKFLAKQQFKFLAGIGVLSIATYITSNSPDLHDAN